MIKGLFIASRSVASTLALLVIFVYVFSMAFRQLSQDTPTGDEYFKSVPHGMKTLLVTAAMPDAVDLVDGFGDDNILATILIVVYFSIASLTLLNMLIGVLCEVINVVSLVEREAMQVAFVKAAVTKACKEAGVGVNDSVNKEQFLNVLMQPGAVKGLRAAGVDPVGLVDSADFIFSDDFHSSNGSGLLSFEQLIETILELGGTNAATVKDVIDARKVVVDKIESVDGTLEARLSQIAEVMAPLMASTPWLNGNDVVKFKPPLTL